MKFITTIILMFITFSSLAFDGKAKPIQVIMPQSSGGGVDEMFRHLQKYSASHGINLIGVYKPGGNGIISINELRNSPKDGYTVMITTAAMLGDYKSKTQNFDIMPLTVMKISNMSIISKKNSFVKDYDALEETLKTPNQTIRVGISNVNHKITLDQIIKNTDVKATIVEVPYKGAALAINDLFGGHIDIVIASLNITKNHVDTGKANLIATSFKINSTTSLLEKIPNFKINEGLIFAVHKDTNKSSIVFYNELLKNYLSNEDVKKDFVSSHSIITEFGSQKALSIIQNASQLLN